jgi:hypothetical protein
LRLLDLFCPPSARCRRDHHVVQPGDGRPKVLRAQVSIPHHHRQGRVPQQTLEFRERSAPLDGPGGEGVPRVMEVEPV